MTILHRRYLLILSALFFILWAVQALRPMAFEGETGKQRISS
jgi:hypothetical protein